MTFSECRILSILNGIEFCLENRLLFFHISNKYSEYLQKKIDVLFKNGSNINKTQSIEWNWAWAKIKWEDKIFGENAWFLNNSHFLAVYLKWNTMVGEKNRRLHTMLRTGISYTYLILMKRNQNLISQMYQSTLEKL